MANNNITRKEVDLIVRQEAELIEKQAYLAKCEAAKETQAKVLRYLELVATTAKVEYEKLKAKVDASASTKTPEIKSFTSADLGIAASRARTFVMPIHSKYSPDSDIKVTGWTASEFTYYQQHIQSFESVCFFAIEMYLSKVKLHGVIPNGFKTSFAKKILLHHNEHSIKTARNLISLAWKCQEHYSSHIDVIYKDLKFLPEFKKVAVESLSKTFKKDLKSAGYTTAMAEMGTYLAAMTS